MAILNNGSIITTTVNLSQSTEIIVKPIPVRVSGQGWPKGGK